jgi:hypothetical protein
MSAMATAAPAALAARHAARGKAVRKTASASLRRGATKTARRGPLKCDAIFDQLKSGFDNLLKGDPSAGSKLTAHSRSLFYLVTSSN